ncbi:uncharacterized protein LOC110006898, partial [Amborella trichopoda]|uniref:uncharacterized protein LOC110006898 n=1 Tax=Amborella trichopoda TaxID=13333 RepID=UPI0009BDCE1D
MGFASFIGNGFVPSKPLVHNRITSSCLVLFSPSSPSLPRWIRHVTGYPLNPQTVGVDLNADEGNFGFPQLPRQGCSIHSFRTITYKLSFMESSSRITVEFLSFI